MLRDEIEKLERSAAVFKALSHPARIYIVERLLEKEHCVGELTGLVGMEMPTVSKHLSILKGAGIIASRKESNNVYYRVRRPCVRDVLDCVASGGHPE
jgi:ArsR family transcriptional regulator